MAQRANITLTDAESTPVNRVFKPYTPAGQSSMIAWRDSNQSIYAGQAVLSVEQRVPNKQTRATKYLWRLETPILEVTSPSTSSGIQPAPTVAYSCWGELRLTLPDRASLQDRKNVLAMLRDLIDEAIVTSQVYDLELIY
jgi:hypothetical protein